MDSPKVMVNIISGIHGSMGPVRLTANTGASCCSLSHPGGRAVHRAMNRRHGRM
jgi:hypothetical protein